MGKDATKSFVEMAKEVDKSGFVPLLLACRAYSQWEVRIFEILEEYSCNNIYNNKISQKFIVETYFILIHCRKMTVIMMTEVLTRKRYYFFSIYCFAFYDLK